MSLSVGQKVMFGRPNGEKTEGVIEKINAKSVKVKQTEARGGHPVGTIWTVHSSLVSLRDSAFTVVTIAPVEADNHLWNLHAPRFGLPIDLVGKSFTAKGTEYQIRGINPSRPKFPVDCVRVRDNRPFKFTTQGVIDGLASGVKAPTASKRPDSAILADILGVYSALSPENLHCDGEISRAAAARKEVALRAKLRTLFTEIGRTVSETEAFRASI